MVGALDNVDILLLSPYSHFESQIIHTLIAKEVHNVQLKGHTQTAIFAESEFSKGRKVG